MAYLGVPQSKLENLTTNVQIVNLSASFDGTTVTFNLQDSRGNAVYAVADRRLLVILGGITQKPGVDYTTSGTTITFTTAPVSNLTIEIRKFYGVQRIIGVNDGVITPIKLSAGGPSWNSSGNVTISGDLNVTGAFNAGGNGLFWEDNEKANFGSNNDLQIYHNGVNSFIRDAGTGSLFIEGTDLTLRAADSTTRYLVANETNGDVSLFYGNNVKLATKTDGVNITGELECDSLDVDGAANIQSVLTMQSYIQGTTTLDLYGDSSASQGLSLDAGGNVTLQANLDLQDNDKILLGTSNDLDIYHDGTDSYLRNQTGQLLIRSDDIKLNNYLGTKTHAEFIDGGLKTGSIDLFDVSSSISDTAVDIFIYDTSKDSDGGAWRKRTQHTSWYNETLNTATRGSRREFPAVAVLVLYDGGEALRIYDGDDPDLPMWMDFTNTSGRNYFYGTGQAQSIAMLNGMFVTGSQATNFWPILVDFLRDDCIGLRISGGNMWHGANIVGRNTSVTDSSVYWSEGSRKQNLWYINGYIVNQKVNDVAMTVLPNAPIDSATGLPVPTITVATDGGVSVIKDDGSVVDLTGFAPVRTIHIDSNSVIGSVDTSGNDYLYKTSIPAADVVYNTDITAGSTNYYMSSTSSSATIPILRDRNVSATAYNSKDDTLYRGGNNGLDVIKTGQAVSNTVSNSLITYLTSDFNTGYMHGDIKGAFLSDTDATNLSGGNKVTNGDAWSGALALQSSVAPTGWTGGNGATFKTATGNGSNGTYIRLYNENNGGGGPNSYMSHAITTVVGKKYKISVTQIHHATISVFFRAGTQETYSDLVQNSWISSSGSTPRYEHNTFTATGTTTYITLGIVSGTHNYSVGWDDVVVSEVDEDRSVNNNGLHSFGTITKSAVATGAELVGYSGWSASNYLQQPYNSAMEFGTGDFYMMAWIKNTDSTNNQKIITRDLNSTSRLQLYTAGTKFQIYTEDAGSGSYLSSTSDYTTGEWICVIGGRKSSTLQMYVNGKFESGTGSNTNIARDLSFGAETTVEIGRSNTGTANYFRGSIALARIGAGFPSAEQIKKMYEDERWLFQENAKCTLYGSSDAVTALAYDEVTEQLHVGTSSGRSDFQGLRRINNTTTAVTTAISAHDEFIVEQ